MNNRGTIELTPHVEGKGRFNVLPNVWLHCSKSNVTAEKVKMKWLEAPFLSDIDSVWWSYFLILKDSIRSLYKQPACESYQCMGGLSKCCVLCSAVLWPYHSCAETFMRACVVLVSPTRLCLSFLSLMLWTCSQAPNTLKSFLLPAARLSNKIICSRDLSS